jgi:hypothetical protein
MATPPARQPGRQAASLPGTAKPRLLESAGQALERNEGFVGLMRRLELSQGCYAAITPLLPTAMQASVRAGPLEGDSWSLLADSASVAAKLRQLLPALQQRLRDAGLFVGTIRVKVLPRR